MDYWERQYNPRVSIRDPERHFDEWRRRAAEARKSLAGRRDIAYGAHERERLDVFRAAEARGTLVFLHGGYWRAFAKEDFSWIAQAYVRAGISVAIPSYPLCPQVRLSAICESVSRAVDYIARVELTCAERRNLVIAGHSAGAHLAAWYLASAPADAIVCVSGLFDLLPLLHTQFLSGMGWEAAELHAISPLYAPPPDKGRVLLVVGENESAEFHRQSERFAEAWADRGPRLVRVPRTNHFTVLDALGDSDHALTRDILDLFD